MALSSTNQPIIARGACMQAADINPALLSSGQWPRGVLLGFWGPFPCNCCVVKSPFKHDIANRM